MTVLHVPRSVNLQTDADLSRAYSQYQCMGVKYMPRTETSYASLVSGHAS